MLQYNDGAGNKFPCFLQTNEDSIRFCEQKYKTKTKFIDSLIILYPSTKSLGSNVREKISWMHKVFFQKNSSIYCTNTFSLSTRVASTIVRYFRSKHCTTIRYCTYRTLMKTVRYDIFIISLLSHTIKNSLLMKKSRCKQQQWCSIIVI